MGEITPTDGVAVTFKDPAFSDALQYCRGFHVNLDGDLYVVLAGDTSPVRLSVKVGIYYPYSVKEFRSTSTTSGMKVVPLR